MNLSLRNPWLHMLGRRGLQVVALALIIGTLCFFMMRALPGDLAMRVAASRYGLDLVSGAAADAVRAEMGLSDMNWRAPRMMEDTGSVRTRAGRGRSIY